MDQQQSQPPQPVAPVTPPKPAPLPSAFSTPPKTKSHKFLLTLFALFILAFVGVSGYFFGLQQGMQMAQQQSLQQAKPVSQKAQIIPVSEITSKTKVAKLLTLPKLYDGLTWNDITKTASVDGLMTVTAEKLGTKGKTTSVSFDADQVIEASKIYTSSEDANLVSTYYTSQLQKLDWVTPGKFPYLTFHTYRLLLPLANGPCGGVTGYLGYKDNYVKLFVITYTTTPCVLNVTNALLLPRPRSITYTLYSSKLYSVQDLTNYIKTHTKE